MKKFEGTKRQREAQARKYVLLIARTILWSDKGDPDGWLLGGVVDKDDVALIRAAANALGRQLYARGCKP